MEVYRIAKTEYQEINGTGGLLYSGRWHEKGNRVVYTSQYRSLAAFEAMVHISRPVILQNSFTLITISIPDNASILELTNDILKPGWDSFEYKSELQQTGTNFLRENKYLLLKVPSVIIKQEFNFIINPIHPLFKECEIINSEPFLFDRRL